MATPIGRRVGRWARKGGAAGSMARAAPARAAAVHQSSPLRHPTTATQASPTGWPDGACRRRHGAARMQARAARQLLEAAPERCEQFEHSKRSLGAGALRHLLVLAGCAGNAGFL